MLTLVIPSKELFDEINSIFIPIKGQTIQLEHSLVSISKWEAKYHKPFIGNKSLSSAELVDYIRCMTIMSNVNPMVYDYALTDEMINSIKNYIDDPMTATTISDSKKQASTEIVTSEIIYYWMVALNIPFECQKWHLNRLLTLIRVCEIKQDNANPNSKRKMSKAETYSQYKSLNAMRRAASHSKG